MALKLILMSPDGTVGSDGKADDNVVRDLCKFIARMATRGVEVALWARHRKVLNGQPLEAYLAREAKTPVRHFQAGAGAFPIRRYAGSVNPVLSATGAALNETILVGSKKEDMLAGVNNGLLLVRPAWYGEDMEYGFRVRSIGELGRFCEVFALREHPIYWAINSGNLHALSMGPFSTYFAEFAEYGSDARQVAKENKGNHDFWFFAVVSTLYFSGIVHGADFICPFPGHNPAATGGIRELLDAVMTKFGKCFKKPYLPNLIVRHVKSQKSQFLKPDQKSFRNHLNTIHLNQRPRHYDRPEPPRAMLSLKNKRVLVVDDFVTNGRSLDTARAYIEAAGGTAVLFSWLKTVNTSFNHMRPDPALSPYQPNRVATEPSAASFGYAAHVVDPVASKEMQTIFEAYTGWQWA
jgi:predicted amidophosphoribosyltransferase